MSKECSSSETATTKTWLAPQRKNCSTVNDNDNYNEKHNKDKDKDNDKDLAALSVQELLNCESSQVPKPTCFFKSGGDPIYCEFADPAVDDNCEWLLAGLHLSKQ